MTAKTTAERQREFRERWAEKNATEVRGIFAHADDHPAIKEVAVKLARKRLKQQKRPIELVGIETRL